MSEEMAKVDVTTLGNTSRQQWNSHYKTANRNDINHDNWLEHHKQLFSTRERILELGCGFGYNSLYLSALGYQVVATDFSREVLEKIRKIDGSISTKEMDITDCSSIGAESFETVIADFCLHYFSHRQLTSIIAELWRITGNAGKLFFRVNSLSEKKGGIEVEENYYYHDGIYRMYFSEEMIRQYFSKWDILSLTNYNINRRGEKQKNLYEVVCRKP